MKKQSAFLYLMRASERRPGPCLTLSRKPTSKNLEVWPTLVGDTTFPGSGAAGSALDLLLAPSVAPANKPRVQTSSSSTKLTFSLRGKRSTPHAVGSSAWLPSMCFHAHCARASKREMYACVYACVNGSEYTRERSCEYPPRTRTVWYYSPSVFIRAWHQQ